ncbi:MAG TPA: hypothetical protein VNX21_09270 [Candidatus Thermoplasmatota archaeon]|nr:hypothetical protein [Candidatus Thermoplasmatota archaeon]
MKVALAWAGGLGSLASLDALRGRDVTLVHAPLSEGSLAHLPRYVVEAQAAALRLPLAWAPAPDPHALAEAAARAGAQALALGLLRGEDHDAYRLARALHEHRVEGAFPVRHLPAAEAARGLVETGHRLFARACRPPFDASLLGRFLDAGAVDEVDAVAGRRGWTAVRFLAVDGPLFRRRVEATALEPRTAGDGWRLDLGLQGC